MANNVANIFVWLLCAKSVFLAGAVASSDAEGACKSRVQIYDYTCEEHTVTTEDGYILSLQRIPKGRSDQSPELNRLPVLLQHGLIMDGTSWLLNSPDESLGFILADSGYDVWIANARGTVYSSEHTSLSSSDPAYWDWSWDELAAYDLTANVGYVYSQSSNKKIHYVGHSLGTLVALASFSQHNLLNMVRSAALLCPIAHLDRVPSPLAQAGARTFSYEVEYWLGMVKFDPASQAVRNLLATICANGGIDCFDLWAPLTGTNCCLNSSTIDVYLAHEPQPTATRNFIHLSQMIRQGTITKYDYLNIVENIKHYGQVTPPAYIMSNIPNDIPLFISYGARDLLSDPQDVQQLLDDLRSHDRDKLTVQYVDNYAHIDFIMAVNAKQVVYDPLIAFYNLH